MNRENYLHQRTALAGGAAGLFPRRRGWWRLVLLIIIIGTAVGYVSPVRAYISRSEQISIEQSATSDLQRQHEQLLTEKERLQNQAYVEQVARMDLGLVKPGEQSYVLKDLEHGDETAVDPAIPQEEESFFSSVMEAVGSLLP